MHTLTAKLRIEMTDFIAQRDALWLLVDCSAADAPIVFKLLRECERNSSSEVFLLFGVPFVNAEQYAEEVVAQLVADYQALDAARMAQGHPRLGSLPDVLLRHPEVTTEPAQRIAAVVEAARALLPSDGIYRLVGAFWPMQVADPVAYGKLLESLIVLSGDSGLGKREGLPWKQSVRLIGREIGAAPVLARSAPYVLRIASDFSPAAWARSLQQTIDDPQQPEAVRVHALFTQATLDQAQDRMIAAIAKYGQVLAYYQKRQNLDMQTVVLLQLGEAYQKQQRLPAARASYEQALLPAAAMPVPVCAARLAKNLGEVAFLQQRYGDAAIAYKTWHRIAEQLGDQEGVAAALAKLAAVQEQSRPAPVRTPSSHPLEAVR